MLALFSIASNNLYFRIGLFPAFDSPLFHNSTFKSTTVIRSTCSGVRSGSPGAPLHLHAMSDKIHS